MPFISAGRNRVHRLVFSCLSATIATAGLAQEAQDEGLAEVVVTAASLLAAGRAN